MRAKGAAVKPGPCRGRAFAGSFDPITNGHLDVVASAVRLADRLVLAVGIHPGKPPLFTAEERVAMLEEICGPLARKAGCEIACTTFADLVVTAARRAGATMLIRGLRDSADFDYEMQMAGMNAAMAPEVQTLFLAGFACSAPDHRHVGAADRQHGRRRFGLRTRAGCGAAEA